MDTKTDAQLSSPEAIRQHVALSLPDNALVRGVSLFCTAEHDSHVLCLIDVDGVSASSAAVSIKGQPFGFSSVVVTMPVAGEFVCRQRRLTGAVPAHCTCTPVQPTTQPAIQLD